MRMALYSGNSRGTFYQIQSGQGNICPIKTLSFSTHFQNSLRQTVSNRNVGLRCVNGRPLVQGLLLATFTHPSHLQDSRKEKYMSISPISSVGYTYPTYQTNWQNNVSQVKQDFQSLANDLQSNNLSGAQQDFKALQQLLPDPSASNQTQTGQSGSGQNQFATDLGAVGQDLQSGTLTQAQTDFAKLQQDMQSVQGHHHHHHHHHGSNSTQSTDSTTSNSSAQSTNGSGQTQFTTDLNALSQALQNGNVTQAQAAFATFEQDMQSAAQNFNILV